MKTVIIGDRVKKLRMDMGKTQEEVAKDLGVTKVSICGYETENRIPCLEMAVKLCDYYDVTFDYLTGHELKTEQKVSISSDDLKIIQEIRKNDDLYRFIRKEPARNIRYLAKKVA